MRVSWRLVFAAALAVPVDAWAAPPGYPPPQTFPPPAQGYPPPGFSPPQGYPSARSYAPPQTYPAAGGDPLPQGSATYAPPAAPPSSEKKKETFGTLASASYGAALGIGVTRLTLDPGTVHRTTAGGVAIVAGTMGTVVETLSYYTRLDLFVGGGAGGFETMFGGELYAGYGIPTGNVGQLYLGLGLGGHALKSDELDGYVVTLPGLMLGYQLALEGFGLGIGGVGSLVPRTEYAPGDELQVRRMFRRENTALGYGGTVVLSTKYFFANASLLNLVERSPFTVADGAACLRISALAACGFGQYWRSVASSPTETKTVPSLYLGVTIGIGDSAATRL